MLKRPASGRSRARDRGSNLTEFREFQDDEVIAGTRYRVLRLVGVGGMGSVYEVEHTELGKRFVLKSLLRELSRRDDLVQRLRNEWRALARLDHENIVNVTDAGTSDSGVPFYVMERLDGDTLAGLLRRKRRLHVLEAVNVAASVLSALSAAHDIGIIHRDVKPANVFIVSGGGVKLLDFGIAKIADANGVVTARGLAVGTPRYMSPEQARGESVDGRSDVYASALMLFEMIAGVGPFDDARDANELLLAHLAREAPPLSAFVSGVSPELERILADMLAKDCRQRPAHARVAAERLRSFALRQRSAPATDAPTPQAGYGAETASATRRSERAPNPNHDSVTRAEGALRRQLAHDANSSLDALTQRMELSPATTQVTLSAITGEAFAGSPGPNTTFVSPPAFDGTTTLQMSTVSRSRYTEPSERPEPTEMLGDFPVPVPFELADTHTQVPLPERVRPMNITPPPVVDTGRVERLAPPRPQRPLGRWAALATAGFGLLLVTGLWLRRASVVSENVPASVTAAEPVASKVGSKAVKEAPAAADNGMPSVAPPPAPPSMTVAQPAPSGPLAPPLSSSARNSRMNFDPKRLRTPVLATRSPNPGSLSGPLVRSSEPHSSALPMPSSGL